MDSFDLLDRLTATAGVSGHEAATADVVRAVFAPYVDAMRVDRLGSLIATRRGSLHAENGSAPSPSILLACHMDEIGLMVTRIEAGGFLRFTSVGGWDPRVLLAQPVTVHGRRDLPGLVGSRPPHVLGPDAQDKPVPIDELYVDTGLPEAELRAAVRVGDVISTRRGIRKLAGGLVSGKAFDNRASIAAVAIALEQLATRRHAWDVHAVATVQEEIGLKGAMAASWGIAPTVGIAIDVSFARQHGAGDVEAELGGGPLIGLGPNIHPAMHRALVEAAERLEMRHAIEPLPSGSGTDGWAIQVARAGIPTGLVSIPLRYMHSTVETLALADIERSGRLLAEMITGLDEAFAAGLVDDLRPSGADRAPAAPGGAA
ncbi:MAG: M20/M25/M40 family metallo-hydrolase [Caldilineae bacterium]|nr:M20/M25/M40 family metallo-hydrolase [Chloroflexota bacterium]MCB9177510.1 M20/M25/M40 family metallo-hydrolase [Caldilineae bacterium]